MTVAVTRLLKVFLCHASQDKPAVRELFDALKAEGWIDPWLDKAKILPGQDWEVVIEKAVDSSDVVIVCLSNHSVSKEGFVQREIRYAYDIALDKPEETIFLIPLRLDDCNVPRKLRTLHWGDYFDSGKKDAYSDLLEALQLRYEQKLQLEADAQTEVDERALIQKEVEDKLRRERQETLRQQTEARIRKEMKEAEECSSKEIKPQPILRPSSAPGTNKHILSNGMELLRVPAGKFFIGSRDDNKLARDDERPQHTVDIPYDYYMARLPVTNELYNAYITANRADHPVKDWQKKKDHPVTYVRWSDALAYCKWLNDLLKGELPHNMILRLPTEAEWEKAARGENGNEWPWGNEFDKNKCNSKEGGKGTTTSVELYSPQGDSPYGCADVVGNVWEWTHSLFKPYPYKASDGRENETASSSHVMRGGSYYFEKNHARCAIRSDFINFLYVSGGFRVCASPNLS